MVSIPGCSLWQIPRTEASGGKMMGEYVACARPLPVFLGRCGKCPRPIRVNDDSAVPDHLTRGCVDCGAPVMVERLYGTVTRMTCDPRCEGAYGPSCECGCGGINHGGVWSEPGRMLAGELEAYRAEIAKREAERQARVTRERDRKLAAFNRWRAGNEPAVTDLLGTDWELCEFPNGFLADLAGQLRRHDVLSERQVAAATRTMGKRRDAAEAAARRKAAATEVPSGRHEVTGTVTGKYWRDNPFNPYSDGQDVLCIVVDTGAFRVRGTCPRSLWFKGPNMGIDRGDRVTFSAELKPDGKEVGSGYFKRPTKAAFA